jgi:superoxide dismutase, Fe-Mn family
MNKYVLPELPYAYDALEPSIDAKTMEIHHGKHHDAYVKNLNAALDKHPHLYDVSLESLLLNLSSVPADIRTAVRNHGGGHYNHSLFWKELGGKMGGMPASGLLKAIEKDFGSYDAFIKEFEAAALQRFGSGWAWLSMDSFGKLVVSSTANQDNPVMEDMAPVFGIDVWEHAYYLKYQNRRADYMAAFWKVLNWETAERNFELARTGVNDCLPSFRMQTVS